ncbi:hypothetical protein [Thalassospira tepidiphila]|uniref:hypothetical protein n=1 Tax=Thalassospira tepidiphila TaxID=393657 RepID=UPI00291F703B|nr:hypothetical protein MACH01_29640 [Thalassospira tepidiphila]
MDWSIIMENYPNGLDTRYDRFLQTRIGAGLNGTPVTTLSMLARLGLDPWQVARDLSAMSKETAWATLEKVMISFADLTHSAKSRQNIVTGLIASLH